MFFFTILQVSMLLQRQFIRNKSVRTITEGWHHMRQTNTARNHFVSREQRVTAFHPDLSEHDDHHKDDVV